MNPSTITSFLKNYIVSLKERTRVEEKGVTTGIDNLFYSLGIAQKWKPQRLPFYPAGDGETGKTKPEGEFGVDVSFTRADGTELVIFVLKDEPLTYHNFTKGPDFESDLRRAINYNIDRPELKQVTSVVIVLGYNKGENSTGLDSYNGFVSNAPKLMGPNHTTTVRHERWNLSEIISQVEQHLLSPALLPQRYFGRLTYLCSQFGDFSYSSDAWMNQLVPNWRGFLKELLVIRDAEDLQRVAVALFIIRSHGKNNANFETAWLDLLEWAVLALWDAYLTTPSPRALEIVREVWVSLYIVELERFYRANRATIATEHSIDSVAIGSHLAPYAANFVSFWHLGRLGILAFALHELQSNSKPEHKVAMGEKMEATADVIASMLNAQSSATYPLLDIQHIELFLVWRAMWAVGRDWDIEVWLEKMIYRLSLHKDGHGEVPHISPYGWPHLLEEVSRSLPRNIRGQSSYLLYMLMELLFTISAEKREVLSKFLVNRVAKGPNDKTSDDSIHLILWAAAKTWGDTILRDHAPAGVEVSIDFPSNPQATEPISPKVEQFVSATRAAYPFKQPNIFGSVFALACLKHQSPLPAEMWRGILFPVVAVEGSPAPSTV